MSQLEIEINDISNNTDDSPPVIDTSDLDLNHLDDDTTIDVSGNKNLKTSNEPEQFLATTKMTGLFPTTSNSRKTHQTGHMKRHKVMLNALKKYKKNKSKEENQPIDKQGRFCFNSEKISFQEVEFELGEIYHSYNEYFSSAMDILASYVKGQKIIYMEAESYCQTRLNKLMFPSIFISAGASVCAAALKGAEWGGTFLASLNAGISFLLAIVSYLKLDAQSQAHKTSAHQYDKLQSICEFASGSLLLFTDMTGFDKKGTVKEREKLQLIEVGAKIRKQLEEIEAKIKEI